MRRRVIPVVLVAALAAACGSRETPAPAKGADKPARAVRTANVRRVDGADVPVPGVVRAREHAVLASRVMAAVVALPYREGDRVAKGAVVARLDATALQAALSAAEAAHAAAAADLARAEALVAKGAATAREKDVALAGESAARAGVAGARSQLDYAVLRAPFAGRIAARPAGVGDVVAPGMPIVEVEGGGGLEVRASIDGTQAAAVRPGLVVQVAVDGQVAPLSATVRALSPAGDPSTHRFELVADLPASDGLRSGLFARVALPGAQAGGARLLVPAAAVLHRGGLVGVFVVDGAKARLRWIAAGAAQDDAIEVRAGLEAGERVVLDPEGLEDGAAVEARS